MAGKQRKSLSELTASNEAPPEVLKTLNDLDSIINGGDESKIHPFTDNTKDQKGINSSSNNSDVDKSPTLQSKPITQKIQKIRATISNDFFEYSFDIVDYAENELAILIDLEPEDFTFSPKNEKIQQFDLEIGNRIFQVNYVGKPVYFNTINRHVLILIKVEYVEEE